MKKVFVTGMILLICCAACAQWPAITSQTKPWTRWWWMGSAVDEKNITALIQQYSNAGFGGTEVVPIYGAKGYESRYIKYLSPQWMHMLDHTVKQSAAHNMGVYIAVGTGWPIGGADVTVEDAATKMIVQQYEMKAGETLKEKIVVNDVKQKKAAVLSKLMAFDAGNHPIDLTGKLTPDGTLQYTAPADLKLYALFSGKTLQKVKRAAPGGEGYTIDHFSKNATANYFKIFDTAFGNSAHGVKGFFNDSYEVYNADWTPDFFNAFKQRRGYNLSNYLYLLLSNSGDSAARIKSDYRETMSDLMRENFSTVFTSWTHQRNALSINQAHGSPGNLLDLYGAFDIPECETFGSSYFPVKGLRRDSADIRKVDPDPFMLKFASSAAHVYGKPLTSCETFTWLGEHFKTSWSQCKPEVDQAFLAGINHVFYHGTTYSPQDADWPGWLFYASVQFLPNNSLWPHLKGLNDYIARCQSVLQEGIPDNDVLVYWPVYDAWHKAGGMDMPLAVHGIKEWLHPTAFYKDITQLQESGFTLDYSSDLMLAQAHAGGNTIQVNAKGAAYKTLVVPYCEQMPVATLENILRIAAEGGVVVLQAPPQTVPGLLDIEKRKAALQSLLNKVVFDQEKNGIKSARVGKGKIYLSNDIGATLQQAGVLPEKMAAAGLQFIRRKKGTTSYYFIVNLTGHTVDQQLQLNTSAKELLLMNPLNGEVNSTASAMINGNTSFRVQLQSGESVIVQCSNQKQSAAPYRYANQKGDVIELQNNNWTLHFVSGGPQLPADKKMLTLQPWTNFTEDSSTQSFSGTGVYTTTFDIKNKAADYLLQLDQLYESARIIINGKDAGLIWSLPYNLRVGKYLKQGRNSISIEVSNLMANRIRNMDRNKEVWRNYHEINFVNINYESFDASGWKVMPSGLGGVLKLTPLEK